MKEQQTLFDATVEDTESKKISDEIKRLVCKVAEIQLQNEWSKPEPINAKNRNGYRSTGLKKDGTQPFLLYVLGGQYCLC